MHFATHGFFAAAQDKPTGSSRATPFASERAGDHPGLLSGRVFAGANRSNSIDHGLLTALEIAELDLRGVRLAVLSACETGLGQVASGEGVLGLQRAFQVAGAKSVVSSLWKVDDEATRKLMSRFYDNLWARACPGSTPYTRRNSGC